MEEYNLDIYTNKPQNKPRNASVFKEIVIDVWGTSTMHGLSKVIKSKSWSLKIMWLLCLFIGIGSFAKFSLNSVSDFLDYEVTTKIRRIYETPTIYPTISICNKNKFTTDFGIDTIKSTLEYFKYPDLFNFSVLSHLPLEDRYRDSDNALFRAGNAVSEFSVENKKKLGHSIEEFMIECKFDDVFCNITEDFVWYFDNIYGNCYKFNSGFNSKGEPVALKKSSQPGKFYLGLKMTLFDSMPDILERISYAGTGFMIKLDNSSFTAGGNSRIDLLSGVESNLAVERIYSSQLSFPYSDCFIDNMLYSKSYQSELYDLFLKTNTRYRQKDCLELCQQKFYIANCQCTLIQYFSLFNEKICNTIEQLDCAFHVYFEQILASNFFEKNCYPLCPLECNTTEYNAYQSINMFSKDVYLDVIKAKKKFISKYDNKTLNDQAIINGILKVNIYYDSLSYTQITESVSMNQVSLLAAIGGFMGLFLGMSLMTLVELLEIFMKFLIKNL